RLDHDSEVEPDRLGFTHAPGRPADREAQGGQGLARVMLYVGCRDKPARPPRGTCGFHDTARPTVPSQWQFLHSANDKTTRSTCARGSAQGEEMMYRVFLRVFLLLVATIAGVTPALSQSLPTRLVQPGDLIHQGSFTMPDTPDGAG